MGGGFLRVLGLNGMVKGLIVGINALLCFPGWNFGGLLRLRHENTDILLVISTGVYVDV